MESNAGKLHFTGAGCCGESILTKSKCAGGALDSRARLLPRPGDPAVLPVPVPFLLLSQGRLIFQATTRKLRGLALEQLRERKRRRLCARLKDATAADNITLAELDDMSDNDDDDDDGVLGSAAGARGYDYFRPDAIAGGTKRAITAVSLGSGDGDTATFLSSAGEEGHMLENGLVTSIKTPQVFVQNQAVQPYTPSTAGPVSPFDGHAGPGLAGFPRVPPLSTESIAQAHKGLEGAEPLSIRRSASGPVSATDSQRSPLPLSALRSTHSVRSEDGTTRAVRADIHGGGDDDDALLSATRQSAPFHSPVHGLDMSLPGTPLASERAHSLPATSSRSQGGSVGDGKVDDPIGVGEDEKGIYYEILLGSLAPSRVHLDPTDSHRSAISNGSTDQAMNVVSASSNPVVRSTSVAVLQGFDSTSTDALARSPSTPLGKELDDFVASLGLDTDSPVDTPPQQPALPALVGPKGNNVGSAGLDIDTDTPTSADAHLVESGEGEARSDEERGAGARQGLAPGLNRRSILEDRQMLELVATLTSDEEEEEEEGRQLSL
eukprot:TRINITY_DN5512_c0_g1_i1.p1 TRINITY_DN5512_c0_g1~~TRINITY_DN5512_c0_g1_i1.p1  ORF type:complete len:550 (-),score=114.06 TRINITY_DN5512_c0_g1_i1:31-1680(-)